MFPLLVVWSTKPVAAQQGSAPRMTATDSPTSFELANDIRSVREAYEATRAVPAEPVEKAHKEPLAGAIAPQAMLKAFKATAYCLKGQTASGAVVRRGMIAADPRVLPLGSIVRITAGKYSGLYTVMDTGGAIRGRRIDIWVPSLSEARVFGARQVNIEVLRHGWDPDPDTTEADSKASQNR